MKCRAPDCGEEFESIGEISRHYRDAHPGQQSQDVRAQRKRAERASRRGREAPADAPPAPNLSVVADPPAGDDPGPDVAERAPEPTRPKGGGWKERLWGARDDKPDKAPPTRERKPRVRRQSTAGLFEMAWSGLGFVLVRTELDVPVGRCLQYQATIAGPLLEDVTKDTFVDALLQPLAGRLDKMEALGALLAVPMLVGVIERGGPEAQVALEPMLRAALRSQLSAMVPLMKKRAAEEAKWADVVRDLVDAEMVPPGADPVDAILSALFAPAPDAAEASSEGPGANGAGAYNPAEATG